MATQISEQKMIDESLLLYEERLKSPIRRFTDKTFMPVTYFHINSKDTTSDFGFNDVAEIIGSDSPIKYQKILNFPLYDMEALNLQLDQGDQGLDSTFESQATVMAGTIIPLQNDFFMINHLKDPYIFRIKSVEYDTVTSAPCYKIEYALEYIDTEKEEQLNEQTKSEFTCILENIGTDERCIIEQSENERLKKIDAMYDEIADAYITFYYNERYNCLLGDFGNGMKIFDPFMIEFINEHKLFSKKNRIDNLVMTEQFGDPRRRIKYQKTIYRFFELQDLSKLSTFDYIVFRGTTNPETAFSRWLDDSVVILDIPKDITAVTRFSIMDTKFAECIRVNGPTDSKYADLIQRFARKEEITIDEIDLSLSDELLSLDDANLEVFFFTPIILYIIKEVVTKQLRTEFVD